MMIIKEVVSASTDYMPCSQMACQAPQQCLPSSLVFHSQLTGWYQGVSVPRRQRLQAPLQAVKPRALLRAVRHSPQPQVECCRPSPFNPDRAAFTCSHCLHSSGREARSPTWSIQGSGPAHPRTLPPTTLSPSLSPWWDTSSAQGPHPGSSCIYGDAAEAPQAHAGEGSEGRSLCPTCCLGLHPACVLTSAALEESWVVERKGRLLPQTPGP